MLCNVIKMMHVSANIFEIRFFLSSESQIQVGSHYFLYEKIKSNNLASTFRPWLQMYVFRQILLS